MSRVQPGGALTMFGPPGRAGEPTMRAGAGSNLQVVPGVPGPSVRLNVKVADPLSGEHFRPKRLHGYPLSVRDLTVLRLGADRPRHVARPRLVAAGEARVIRSRPDLAARELTPQRGSRSTWWARDRSPRRRG